MVCIYLPKECNTSFANIEIGDMFLDPDTQHLFIRVPQTCGYNAYDINGKEFCLFVNKIVKPVNAEINLSYRYKSNN